MDLNAQVYEQILNASHDAIVIVGLDGNIVFWNEAATDLFGYDADFMIGKDMHDYIAPQRYRDDARKAFKYFLSSGQGTLLGKTVEIEALTKEGKEVWVELSLTSLVIDDNFAAFAIIRDIDQKKRKEIKLKKAVMTDPLTKINNRRAFQKSLDEMEKQDLAVAIIDADYFKSINDNYGHPIGDEVLIDLAQLLADSFPEAESVARLGGEEFGVLFNQADIETVVELCENFRQKMSQQTFSSKNLAVTVSIGIAINQVSVSRMLIDADAALYQAKAAGRDRVFVAEQ